MPTALRKEEAPQAQIFPHFYMRLRAWLFLKDNIIFSHTRISTHALLVLIPILKSGQVFRCL